MPDRGAFEISYKGNLLWSKIKNQRWPKPSDIGIRAKHIVEADDKGEDYTEYLNQNL